MKTKSILLTILLAMSPAIAAAQTMEWKTIDGKSRTMTASHTDGSAVFFQIGARVVPVPISRLHPSSQTNVYSRVRFQPAAHNAPRKERLGSKFGAQPRVAPVDPVTLAVTAWGNIRTRFAGHAILSPTATALRQQLLESGLDPTAIYAVERATKKARVPYAPRPSSTTVGGSR